MPDVRFFNMKKLLLLLILSFFSAQSFAAPSIFSCEVKQDLSIHEDSINDVKTLDTFIFTDEIDNIVFSETPLKDRALFFTRNLKSLNQEEIAMNTST